MTLVKNILQHMEVLIKMFWWISIAYPYFIEVRIGAISALIQMKG